MTAAPWRIQPVAHATAPELANDRCLAKSVHRVPEADGQQTLLIRRSPPQAGRLIRVETGGASQEHSTRS